ncbi:MAG: hypothetical protein ABGZ53_09870 [Fuerstiella sp.]
MTSPKVKDHQAAARRRRLILASVRMTYSKPPPIDDFAEEMFKRLNTACEAAIKSPQQHQWIYINPIAVISCFEPSAVFFAEVRRIQAEWCRRSKTLFPKSVRKSVKDWDGHEPDHTKHARYLRRCLCLRGLMLHAGAPTPHHEWVKVEAQAKKAAQTASQTQSPVPPKGI